MQQTEKRNFDIEAEKWDELPLRIKLANAVSSEIIRHVPISPDMEAMDYGCGTGLVTLNLQPHVRSIIGVDSSRGMLEALDRKIRDRAVTNVTTMHLDIESGDLPKLKFDLVVSSMVMHHVKDPEVLIRTFHRMLHPGGFLCIADLDSEEGDFHAEDATGVHHLGFDRSWVKHAFAEAGFFRIKASTAHMIPRETPVGITKHFPVFLISGMKVSSSR